MIPFFIGLLTCLSAFFRSRYNLGLEILALRQQVGVLKRKRPRPQLGASAINCGLPNRNSCTWYSLRLKFRKSILWSPGSRNRDESQP
jgi:hypothetical protein